MQSDSMHSKIKDEKDYKEVFKSTFLFSFVRVLQMLVGIVRSKLVAIILGPSGIGIMQIYSSATALLKKGCGLGVSQSALRDVSEAKASGNRERFSQIIVTAKRITLFTGAFGLLVTAALSPKLSDWTFGNREHTLRYVFLGLVTFFTICNEVQLSLLKGVRAQKHLVWSSLIGSLSGLFVSVPIFYIWGEEGIVPALIAHAYISYFVTDLFVKKIDYDHVKQPLKETYRLGLPMVRVGGYLMFVGMLDSFFSVVLSSFIGRTDSLDMVGYFQAGSTIMTSYFGIIITSMVMDYYPRISAVHFDNVKVKDELNKQSKIGLLIMLPLVVVFVLFAPYIIDLLYRKDFVCVVSYTDIAIIGATLAVLAECVRMILVAKQTVKTYALTALILKALFIPMYLLLFNKMGLLGLGIAYTLRNVIEVGVYSFIVNYKYKIHIDRETLFLAVLIIILAITTCLVRGISSIAIRYAIGGVIIIGATLYTNNKFKEFMGDSLFNVLKGYVMKSVNKKK